MQVLRRIMRFLLDYKLFSLAVIAVIVGLILASFNQSKILDWVLGTVSILAVLPIVRSMWQDLRTGRYGIDILAVTAIIGSVLLKQYWAGIVIVFMFTGGTTLEDYAEHRAKTELDALLSRVPQQATVIRKSKIINIPVSELRIGDSLMIKPGDIVPADAVIREGTANFDESSLTGESLPQVKQPGDELLSGTINIDGVITAKCLRAAKDSQYEQIIRLVRSAESSQAPVVRLADRYSVPFTIAAYTIALCAWLIGHHAIRFLEVIVVATPCPLLLAAPIAVISGMSRAAKHGIIVKTGSALEQLAKAQTIAFDKTGTLSMGLLRVDRVTALSPHTQETVLSLAASLEQGSSHVLAEAIVSKAKEIQVKFPKSKQVKETAGQGLTASVNGKSVIVGRLNFLDEQRVKLPSKIDANKQNQIATYVAVNGELAGFITFEDELRPESKQTIKQLRGLKLNILMITGDNQASAKAVAKQLGITNVYADALPADKLHIIEKVTDRPVAFVGDGVNDAPVLTAANIGIALGARGSTAASESADMVIMLDDISRVRQAVEIAKRTFAITRQSILVGIGLSVILMFVFATGHFPPLAGAIIQELVDVIVIFNALRAHGTWRRTTTASSQ